MTPSGKVATKLVKEDGSVCFYGWQCDGSQHPKKKIVFRDRLSLLTSCHNLRGSVKNPLQTISCASAASCQKVIGFQ